jgi:hypothetical protein
MLHNIPMDFITSWKWMDRRRLMSNITQLSKLRNYGKIQKKKEEENKEA